jgi:hypothetical protein
MIVKDVREDGIKSDEEEKNRGEKGEKRKKTSGI